MIPNKQNPDFLHLGRRLMEWYKIHARDLPFRKTKDPYKVWISEIIFQQTRINQGLGHYKRFVERFPTVESLANAPQDDVLLHWKGLGYYSRAMNVHRAAQQIMDDFGGNFPNDYKAILQLRGVGKYTAAAISSICFEGQTPAVDGNFYRVLSRVFADDFDISKHLAFDYFVALALRMAPENMGNFNQAMMDLGADICKPRNPLCSECPLVDDCLAYLSQNVEKFPYKSKKTKVEDQELSYVYTSYKHTFLAKRRDQSSIWKNLYEFPTTETILKKVEDMPFVQSQHKLSHRNLSITIYKYEVESKKSFEKLLEQHTDYMVLDEVTYHDKSFPKPLQTFLEKEFAR